MNIRIKLEIAKILNLDFEWSSSSKKKEDKSDDKQRSIADTANNSTSDNKQ